MRMIWLDEVDSTNAYLSREGSSIDAPAMVIARKQTAGRGQRGNSWESAPGENLTFSVLIRPAGVRANEQFAISEATALAVADFLERHEIAAKVKWPNDIYVGDKKICGILIRHSLTGAEISWSILGVGVNINQTEFVSDAPNPVSMKMLTGIAYLLEPLADEMRECLQRRLEMIHDAKQRKELHEEFISRLWRGDGALHPFADTATGENFQATIDDIDPTGVMTLRLPDGSRRGYRFKEVTFML